MKVKDVCYENSGFVDIVKPDDSIAKVIRVMGTNKETRTVFVVDEEDEVKGAITIQTLFDALFDELKPKIFDWSKKKKLLARDIMSDVITVSLDDDLDDALRAAATIKIQDLPVCNEGKLVAELDCFELLYGMFPKEKRTKFNFI